MSSNWRLQNRYIMLTYKTHLDKMALAEFIRTICPSAKCVIGHEQESSKTDYKHTHCAIDFGKKFSTRDCRKFDYEGIHPNIQSYNKKDFHKNVLVYATKEDKEALTEIDQESDISFYDMIESCGSQKEAMATCKRPGDVLGTKLMYELTREPKRQRLMPNEPTYPWQIDILKLVDDFVTEDNMRKIIWVWDTIGGQGKSTFCRWLTMNYPDDWLCCTDLGTTRDAATLIKNHLDAGWTGKGVTINLGRSQKNSESRIYAYLEAIKDGYISCQKYDGKAIMFDIPHLVIFANHPPRVVNCKGELTLTLDRWQIYKLNDKKEMEYVTPEDVIIENRLNDEFQ